MTNNFITDLNAINRTFLFFNDRKGLEDFTGLNFSNNNTSAKFSFEKRYNAYEKLSDYAKNNCNVDLKILLETYEEISKLITDEKPSTLKELNIYDIIDDFINENDKVENLSLKAAFLVLILTGLLPKYSSRKGNVENIENNFEKFYSLIEDYCKKNGKIDYGYLKIHREQFQQVDSQDLSRILLISIASDVLTTLKNYNNPQSRFAVSKDFRTEFYDIDGIYCNTKDGNINDFWTLEYDDNEKKNYFLSHYFTRNNRTECVFYQAVMKNYLSLTHLTVMSEKFWRTFCENGSVENEQALFWIEFSSDKISFERIDSDGFDINLTVLYRVDNIDSYVPKIENSVLITEPKYLYTKSGKITAVTEDYLIFELPDDVKSALKTTEKQLKIPRTDDLRCYESINDEVCFVIFEDKKVCLAFYALNKFIPINQTVLQV